MARPKKQTVDYFPHDTGASAGDTLTIIQDKFGNDGYAFWFRLLERLGATDGHVIDCRNTVKWRFLLAKTHVGEDKGLAILNLLAELDAIDPQLWEHKVIWCQHFIDNISDAYKNRRRDIPQRPVITGSNPATNSISTGDNPISTGDNPHTKLNKTKLNKTKEGLPDDVKELVTEFLKLPGWGNGKNDVEWLSEFLSDFPQFSVLSLKACRDHHIAKSTKHTRGAWKSRFRNWMTNETKWGQGAKSKSRELPTTYTPQREYD